MAGLTPVVDHDWFYMSPEEQRQWSEEWDHDQKVEYLRSKGIENPEQHWSVQPEKKDED